ncbi:EVE domain-containing protein [Candidatus Omnitrophota bacterium]
MSLSELTDRQAILKAIEEFDELGRNNFLRKYGFRQARSYFILYQGARYDSKAIYGVAFGHQHPDKGYLRAKDFSGGESTVARHLRKLGFEVTTTGYSPRVPQVWAFCANPKRYRIIEAVAHNEVDYWFTGKSNVRNGDYMIVWQTTDREKRRGIVALGEVISNPEIRTDTGNQYWVNPKDGQEAKARVAIRYVKSPNLPLWVNATSDGEFLQSLNVARSKGGTVFHVTSGQWQKIIDMAGGWNTIKRESQTYDPEVSKSDFEQAVKKLKDLEGLDNETSSTSREEQSFLRKQLFEHKKTAECGICGREFPVDLLIAAHIKKRAQCTTEERLDYQNVVMPMCVFGCDRLYENGYIIVENGNISINKEVRSIVVNKYIQSIEGKFCPHWNENSRKYFEWHKKHHNV